MKEERIGIYKIVKLLGGGELGRVYLVEDMEGGGLYALKLLSETISSADSKLRRFRREFLTLSRLRHPNIVEVYESGTFRDSLYFVMEYIQGPNLRRHFFPHRRPKFDDPHRHHNWIQSLYTNEREIEIVKVIREITEALSFIHSYGIVHRDLKPENILLKNGDTVKLLDFGIAARLGQSELLSAQNIMGTLTYISPEQAQCDEIDGRSDLYTLGVIFYELLTGRPPFVAEEPIACLYLHLNQQPTPPSYWNPYISPELDEIVLKLLAKNPLQRFQRAETLAEALDSFLSKRGHLSLPHASLKNEIRLSEPSFIGRESELQGLLNQIEHLRSERYGSIAVISGVGGIGKSRLARETLAFARIQQIETCTIRCIPDAPPYTAYQEVAEQLQTSLTLRDERLPETIWGNKLQRWLKNMLGDTTLSVDLDTLTPDMDTPETEKFAIFDGFTEILRLFLQREPLLIFIDDIMFMDQSSLELTEYLIKKLLFSPQPLPLLFIFSFRSEDVGPNHPLNQFLLSIYNQKERVQLYELQPLTSEELLALAESMLGLPPDETALKQLIAQSQGIPFFAQELIKAWYEEKQIIEAGDCWFLLSTAYSQEEREAQPTNLPLTLVKRFKRRFLRLSKPAQELAAWLAIYGQELTYENLLKLSRLPEEQFITSLEELLQHKIIVEDWSRGEESYRLAHPGWYDTITDELPPDEKKRYHLEVARFIKRHHQEERYFEILGQHFLKAGDVGQAAWYFLLAAERHLRATAFIDAENLLERCTQLLNSYPREPLLQPNTSWWLRYQLAQFELLDYRGRYREGLQRVQEALQLYPPHSDHSPLWYWEARFSRLLGDFNRAIGKIQEALENSPPDSDWRSPILQEAGRIFRAKGKWNLALRALREAIEWAKEYSHSVQEGRLMCSVGEILHQIGHLDKASEHYYRALEIASQNSDLYGEIEVLCRIASIQLDRAETEDATKLTEKALSSAKELGTKQLQIPALLLLGQIFCARNLFLEAHSHYTEALNLAKELNIERSQAEIYSMLGQLFFLKGEYPTAEKYFQNALEISVKIGLPQTKIRTRSFLNILAWQHRRKQPDEIIKEFYAIDKICESHLFIENNIINKILHAKYLRLIGEFERADDLLSLARFTAQHFQFRKYIALIERERYKLSLSSW